MSEKCDRCGKVMERSDYDAEHAIIHVGTSGTHPEQGVFFGDAFYLLCHNCLEEWRDEFAGWLDKNEPVTCPWCSRVMFCNSENHRPIWYRDDSAYIKGMQHKIKQLEDMLKDNTE